MCTVTAIRAQISPQYRISFQISGRLALPWWSAAHIARIRNDESTRRAFPAGFSYQNEKEDAAYLVLCYFVHERNTQGRGRLGYFGSRYHSARINSPRHCHRPDDASAMSKMPSSSDTGKSPCHPRFESHTSKHQMTVSGSRDVCAHANFFCGKICIQ